MRIFLFKILLFSFISGLMATHYTVDDPGDFHDVFSGLSPGDSVRIAEGSYQTERIHTFRQSGTAEKPITIYGDGIRKTVLFPTNGKTFRVFGDHYRIENITFDGDGGGDPFEAMGNYIHIQYCSFEDANIGLKISGDHFRGSHLFIYSNEKEGIEINGGFIYREGWANDVIRIKQAIGLLPGREAERDKWTAAQLTEMETLWDRREMDCILEYVFLYENGINRYPDKGFPDGWKYGQALYGGQIKAVPNVSGLTLFRCFSAGGQWSNYWIDFPSKGENIFSELYAVGGQHGVHIEGGDETDHQTTVENSVFWNVHQGIFNSASSSNIYRNNLIGSYKYGMVNHGMKGNRVDRNTIARYENNKVYMFPDSVLRVGVVEWEEPKGHLVWFTGPNANGSERIGNTFYLTPDFPELKISNSVDQGYSFAPGDLGELFPTEEAVLDSIPAFQTPSWASELPLFDTYFKYEGSVSNPGGEPIDTTIVEPPMNTGKPRVWVVCDLAGTRTDKDNIGFGAFNLLFLDRIDLQGYTVGAHKWQLNDALDYFNSELGVAYSKERAALNNTYGGFPERLPMHLASTTGKGFQAGIEDLSQWPSLEAMYQAGKAGKLNILVGGPLGEVASVMDYCLRKDPATLANFTIISHATSPSDQNNCARDANACAYLKGLAAQDKIKLIEAGKSGQIFIDDKTFPLLSLVVLESKIGKYFGEKWQNQKPDFSDGIVLILLVFPEIVGDNFISTLATDGTDNIDKILLAVSGKKQILYTLIEEKANVAKSGTIINPPDPTGPTLAERKAFLVQIGNTIISFSNINQEPTAAEEKTFLINIANIILEFSTKF